MTIAVRPVSAPTAASYHLARAPRDRCDVHGPEERNATYEAVLAAVPALRMTVEDVACEGDRAIVRWHASGTHAGRGLGLEPTHQPISTRGMTWLRVREGRVRSAGTLLDRHEVVIRPGPMDEILRMPVSGELRAMKAVG